LATSGGTLNNQAAAAHIQWAMKFGFQLARLLLAATLTLPLAAQVAAPTAPPQPTNGISTPAGDIGATVASIQAAAQATTADLNRLRIEKWKTDNNTRQQTQANTNSVLRNLGNALPALLQQAQAAPASVGAQFKLYRNIAALYEVLSSVTESAGAFGSKQEYESLTADLQRLDDARRNLANRVEALTTQQDAELTRLRAQIAAAAAAAPQPQPGRKIIVDNSEPPKKSSSKKATPKKQAPPNSQK
jgi:hypothetical protein